MLNLILSVTRRVLRYRSYNTLLFKHDSCHVVGNISSMLEKFFHLYKSTTNTKLLADY